MRLEQRFWDKIPKGEPDECWVWRARRNASGYGTFKIGTQSWLAHRVAWTLTNGPIPEDTPCVLHRCDTPPCCNPAHLFLGTQTVNTKDRHDKGRSRGPKGEAHGAARLTAEQVTDIRRRCGAGELQRAVGAEYGIKQARVSEIVLRKKWRHV